MDILLNQLGIALNYTQELLVAALIMARTVTMVVMTPFMGGKLVPTEVKMGLGAMITILVWPLARVGVGDEIPVSAFPFLVLMIKEVFVGFVFGYFNSHLFWAMDMAGRLIDTSRGTSMSEVQDPHSKQRVTPTGNMYVQVFLCIFVGIGGHHVFLDGYFDSFATLPVHRGLNFTDGTFNAFFVESLILVARLWSLSVIIAAPILAATFITDVVFGILNRVAPQLNAYFMSMPVKAYGGIIMIFVAFEVITDRMRDFVVEALRNVAHIIGFLLH